MKIHRWKDVVQEKLSEEQIQTNREWAGQEILEMNLRELRKAAGKTQVELSEATQISQAELSKAERRDDHLLSTLRRYVGALGGELEVYARFGEKTIRLTGV